ncbi:DNA-binding response regulator in two-component regulatory system with ArcB or CpxA [Haemophilus influenzae 22.1-21]|nr:DNA-binding response regulator in two-component regulatory system with ArcB or CpxA [Haemophilus influenzae 22.1-21]
MKKQDLMSIDEIQKLADPDMQKVNQNILAQLNSDVPLIGQLGFLYCSRWW